MKKKRKSVNLGKTGCLCWDTATYSPECCDPDDRYAEEIGVGVGNPVDPIPIEPDLGYGLLYNWYAATDVRGVAPDGFRIPENSDWDSLISELDGFSVSGGKMKSLRVLADGDPYWESPNTGATNSSGFTAFPAGIRNESNGEYQSINTRFEVQSENDTTNTTLWVIQNNSAQFSGSAFFPAKGRGRSIRCVSDTEPSTTIVQDNDGNNYSWVQIGSQYWLQQSLKTTTYNNGDAIATGLDNTAWAATTDGAWAYPNGDSNLPI